MSSVPVSFVTRAFVRGGSTQAAPLAPSGQPAARVWYRRGTDVPRCSAKDTELTDGKGAIRGLSSKLSMPGREQDQISVVYKFGGSSVRDASRMR